MRIAKLQQIVVLAAILLAKRTTADAECPVKGPECKCELADDYPVINCDGLGRITKLPAFSDAHKTFKWLQFRSGSVLHTLKNDSFTHLKIRDLWMVEMQINKIESAAFAGLENVLEELFLGFNQLTNLDGVKELKHLKELSLMANRITHVSESDFAPFARTLKMLDLSRNRLTSIGGAFKSLRNLVELRLRGCHLATLDASAFSNKMSLAVLELSQNELKSVPTKAVAKLTRLSEIHLASNQITSVPKRAFANLNELRAVYLSTNSIEKIEADAFANLTSLRILKLDHNKIRGNITNDMFVNVNAIHTLDLTNNELNSMDDPYPNLGMDALIFLSQNQFHCDCTVAWIRYYTDHVSGTSDRCQTPDEFARRGYMLLNFPSLGCPVPTTPAPTPAGATTMVKHLSMTLAAFCMVVILTISS